MKTAVDWLVDRLYMVIPNEERNFLEGLRKEALEKEKEQILDAHINGQQDHHFSLESRMAESEDYYNETYNQNK
jgi:hypothetical protein